MSHKKTRRDFLRVPPADDTRVSVEQGAASDRPNDNSLTDDAALMMRLSRWAMACQFEIRFPAAMHCMAGGREHDTQLALETLELLESLEEQLSFFRPTSEISRINLLAAERPVEVEPELFQLLCLAKDIWRDTEGAMDITAAPLWQAWGFARRAGAVPGEEQIADALSRVGFQFVELDAQRNTIRFSRPGTQLNLGGIGKGYALDRCAAKLLQSGVENFLLHGGQSSILAHGAEKGTDPICAEHRAPTGTVRSMLGWSGRPGKLDQSPFPISNPSPFSFWTIGIPHPWRAKQRVAEIRLRNRAIGTSSSQFQSFRHEGKLYGHIIDPRTGRPAEGVLSATVVASSSALADALSTAFYVLGLEKSLAYCQTHPEIGMVLLTPPNRGGNSEIHSSGLNDCDLTIK